MPRKFVQLRSKRRTTSARGTVCPPCRTRAAIRWSASWTEGSQGNAMSIRYPPALHRFSSLRYVHPLKVLSNAKSSRALVSLSSSDSTSLPARQCRQFRAKGRQSAGNEVGIHKVNHVRFARQELSGKRSLPRAIRPGNYDALWTFGSRVFHASLTSTRRSYGRMIPLLLFLSRRRAKFPSAPGHIASFNGSPGSTNYAHTRSYHSTRKESNVRSLFQSTPPRARRLAS